MDRNMLGGYGQWAAGLRGEARARFHSAVPGGRTSMNGRRRRARPSTGFSTDRPGCMPRTSGSTGPPPTTAWTSRSSPGNCPTVPAHGPACSSHTAPGEGCPAPAFHDHGGNKYFGRRKIIRTGRRSFPPSSSTSRSTTAESDGRTRWPAGGARCSCMTCFPSRAAGYSPRTSPATWWTGS